MGKYFFTDDTALAAYLHHCGLRFEPFTIALTPGDKRKKYVIFDTKERKELELEFYRRETVIAPLDYNDARVAVSRLLRKTITDPDEVLKYK